MQFTPGITFPNKTVQMGANGELNNCESAAHPKITGGTIWLTGSLDAKCPGPFGPGYAKATIEWNDGTRTVIDQSTFRGDAQPISLEGGSIATGAFAGGTARANGHATSNSYELGASCVAGASPTTAQRSTSSPSAPSESLIRSGPTKQKPAAHLASLRIDVSLSCGLHRSSHQPR